MYKTENIERHLFGRERTNAVAFEFMSDNVGRSHKASSMSPALGKCVQSCEPSS